MANKWVLGINPGIYGMNYHDPSAALFKNSNLICAIEEERLNRKKGSKGIFPIKAIKKCCKIAKIELSDIDIISVGYNPEKRQDRSNLEFFKIFNNLNFLKILDGIPKGKNIPEEEIVNLSKKIITDLINYNSKKDMSSTLRASSKILNEIDTQIKINFHDHHLCHAASAFYPSGFKKSLIIIIDGVGEFETLSVWKGEGKSITKLNSKTLPYSLGYLYAAFTAFLGFIPWNSEGKTMALAPYGKLNMSLVKKISDIKERLILNSFGDDLDLDIEKSTKIIEQEFSLKRRNKDDKIKNVHKDIAYAIQDYLEKEVSNKIKDTMREYKINNICCSGGVFLNCKMNGVLREIRGVKKSYFQPVSKDSGLSIGAALLDIKDPNKFKLNHLGLGEYFTDKQIEMALKKRKIKFKKYSDNKLFQKATDKLLEQEIIFWYQGGLEFGPRSLGFRSILADPRDKKLSDLINKKIKHREQWRPFACSILEEHAKDVLVNYKRLSPFMIEAYKVKKNWLNKIQGVLHTADGTTRPQTVNKKDLPKYHSLIYNFYKKTGIPLLLNTSLNDKGEPIINTPEEALNFFYKFPGNVLILNNFWIEK